jgi:hypothetical protein
MSNIPLHQKEIKMFFMYIFYLLGIIFFIWISWKLVIEPILKDKGIEIENKVDKYTEKLENLRNEYDLMEKSTQAAEEGIWLTKEIKKMENKIKDAEKKMREI